MPAQNYEEAPLREEIKKATLADCLRGEWRCALGETRTPKSVKTTASETATFTNFATRAYDVRFEIFEFTIFEFAI
jgi:hypothetical protein